MKNPKAIALLVFTLLYMLFAQWLYSNKVEGVCCGPEKVIVKTDAQILDESLSFKYQEAIPLLDSASQNQIKEIILKDMTSDNILQIRGHYYDGEEAPEGFNNMGLARATAIKELLKDKLSEDRIDISSRKKRKSKRDTSANQTFAGFNYSWKAPLVKEETTIIALDDEVTIYFPFNSSVRDTNPKVDQYLSQLADRLKQSEEKISIVGHTDNVGEEIDNQNLGMQRAKSIQDALVQRGISINRISIDSKGELQPATSNDTEEGRHRNRRTVLRILN